MTIGVSFGSAATAGQFISSSFIVGVVSGRQVDMSAWADIGHFDCDCELSERAGNMLSKCHMRVARPELMENIRSIFVELLTIEWG